MASMIHPEESSSTSKSTPAPSTSTQATSISVASKPVLVASAPTIRFTTIEELFSQMKRLSDGRLIVTDVSPENYDIISKSHQYGRLRHYYADTQILIIVIPSDLHEQLHLGIYRRFTYSLFQMNLGPGSWKDIGSATFRPEGHPRGDGGEGDSCGGPMETRGGYGKWPTLVIEAGYSETMSDLRKDMRWWFSASEHKVKIILLAKFEQQNNRILIEHYQEEEEQTRSGATYTRSSPRLIPVLQKQISITQNTTSNPPTYNVTRGALTLNFRLLFERDARQGERDIVISAADLQYYAGVVWRQVRPH